MAKCTTKNANSNLFSLCLGVYTHSIAPFEIQLFLYGDIIMLKYRRLKNLKQKLHHQYQHIKSSQKRLFYMHVDLL
jgi:hypothetical protein